ncbi:MAG TPA: anion transporter [Burkholderiales bacterium]|nr:anion transporter [Burkholderiales bacterium]
MTATIVIVFTVVYLGMILGGLPFLQLDRAGVALLGAIALVSFNALNLDEAAGAIHLPTLILLFAFMVISAQMRLGGFYDWVTLRLAALPLKPAWLLGAVMFVIAGLSAVFSNDITCLAISPVLIDACRKRQLDPVPFLLGLACSANIGSAATLIGNPQNILIGQTLGLSFAGYSAQAIPPVLLGLAVSWAFIAWQTHGRWVLSDRAVLAPVASEQRVEQVPLDRWQTTKGLFVAGALLIAFLFTPWPREHVALAGAGILLMSRKLHSRKMLGLVDWQLLILFIGLFVVIHALEQTRLLPSVIADLAASGVHLDQPGGLFAAAFVLSNVVSNVPAVMLLLPVAQHPDAGPLLALVSTLSGNLLVFGSIANIIVLDAAVRKDIHISWSRHAQTGIPVTLATLVITGAFFWLLIDA